MYTRTPPQMCVRTLGTDCRRHPTCMRCDDTQHAHRALVFLTKTPSMHGSIYMQLSCSHLSATSDTVNSLWIDAFGYLTQRHWRPLTPSNPLTVPVTIRPISWIATTAYHVKGTTCVLTHNTVPYACHTATITCFLSLWIDEGYTRKL